MTTFAANHYIPTLKVKRGEKAALRQLSAATRAQASPLLEMVVRTDKSVAAHLDTAFDDLGVSTAGFGRCFIDTRELAVDGPSVATQVFHRAASAGIVFAPVTGITRPHDVAAALEHRTHGVCLRLTREEFEQGSLATRVAQFLSDNGLAPGEVDLVIDLGAVDDMIVDGVAALADAFLAAVPHHAKWRTLTQSACAFPLSMGGVERHSHDLAERSDWMAWRDYLYARRAGRRLPSFGDCAIQHPRGVEGFDPRFMQVSASIRYTTGDHWLLIKGESTRSTPAVMQFPQLATTLVYGHLKNYFAGATHCQGCAGIKAAADGARGYGSAEVWRRIGTIHHISVVTQQLGALGWP